MREKVTLPAAGVAVGIAVGSWQDGAMVWPWVAAGSVALLCAGLASFRSSPVVLALLVVASGCFGAAWFTVRCHCLAEDDLALWLGDEPKLARLRGTALEPPVVRDRSAGSMAMFGHRPPATYFSMKTRAVLWSDGTQTRVRGSVLVRVKETVAPFAAGDEVEALGFLYPPSSPRNPGEFDYFRYARSLGRAGLLSVPRRELVVARIAKPRSGGAWLRWRAALRGRASAWLLSNLPETESNGRDALLAALLLGRRGPELDGLGETFRRAGLSHFLAISGLHLGVMAGFVLFLVRLGGRRRWWHGWLLIAVVALYLFLVEVRMPVLRAGLMTMAACLGLVGGRRLQVSGLVALSAVGLLLWRPDQLFTAGFQLSYGVVLGLIHLSPIVRVRLFGRPDAFASSSAEMIGQWLKTTSAVALTAWAVATPISLYHWGVLWPLAAPFSVIVLPLVAVVLAVGYLKMVLAALLPSAALILGLPLSFLADVLISLVGIMDEVPLSCIQVRHPSAAWSLATLTWFACWVVLGSRVWGFWGGRWGRRTIMAGGVGLGLWLVTPALGLSGPGALRIDMLAIGDGSCYVLRSGSSCVVFDAGSSTDPDAGRRVVIGALARLGVRSIDALVISHPNLDHYSAALEIVDSFDVATVLVTPQFGREAEGDLLGPVMHFLAELADRRVPVFEVAAGERRCFGASRWTWLHPDGQLRYPKANDGSMVIRIEAGGRTVLMCGDIQQQAMKTLVDVPGVDVMELPHHGSFNEQALAFVKTLGPSVIMQSTGRARWERTAALWREALGDAERLVTARDGACVLEIDGAGHITWDRYLDEASVRSP